MSIDWKDALAGLRSGMPEDNAQESAPVANETGSSLHSEESAGMPEAAKGNRLNMAYEKKGRGGKPATILYGFAETADNESIGRLARTLRQRLGVGGSSRGGEILLQGDCREKAAALLRKLGYKM